MSTMQTNKGPPGWCSWGVHSHANHHWFPFRTSICRAGVRIADMGPASFIPIKRVCSVRREWRLQGGVLTPCSCGYRSARAEADRPDPAQTDPHCSDHLHTGGGQTKRRQVNDKVGDRRGVSCDMWVGYAAHARGKSLKIGSLVVAWQWCSYRTVWQEICCSASCCSHFSALIPCEDTLRSPADCISQEAMTPTKFAAIN